MRTQGQAFDRGGSPLPPGTPIRAFIDGVDYSNAPSVRNALGDYIALTEGNWMTGQGDPDTPSLKEGADLNDVVLFAEGDFTIATPVFQETATWSPGRILSLDLNEGSAASTPEPLKIQRILTQPAAGGGQSVWVCNPTGSAVSLADFVLEVDRPGTYHGGQVGLSGALSAGGETRVDVGTGFLEPSGDALKLVFRNPGGPSASAAGRDIVVDRVEFNATSGGTLDWEPGNTILSDAPAPEPGHVLERISLCGDTNDASDFRIAQEPGLPANGPPTVSIAAPLPDQVVQGGQPVPIAWSMSDDIFLSGYLRVWVNVSYAGTSATLLAGARGATSVTWLAPDVDALATVVTVDVVDPYGERAAASRTFNVVRQQPFAGFGVVIGILVAIFLGLAILLGYRYASRRMDQPGMGPPREPPQAPPPKAMPPAEGPAPPEGKKICPRCGTAVNVRDWVCFFCGLRFPEPPS